MDQALLETLLADIDAVNTKDPEQVTDKTGQALGACELYGRRMTEQLHQLCPAPSTALQIAARAQHIERWHLARNSYPMDRAGYHRWRTDLAKHHASRTAGLMENRGAPAALIAQVSSLLRKENLKSNADTQALEDVACLVFLEHYLADFARKHSEEKLIAIIQKTWRKMSEPGHQQALSLPLANHLTELIHKALAQ